MEVLKNLCKINLHLKDASLIWWTGLRETGRNKLAVCCAHPRGLPSCSTSTGFRGPAFPAAFAFSSATLSFVTLTMGTITSALKCIYKYSLRWCNWHKTQTAQLLSHVNISFQITASRITGNRSKFLALDVPMIPAGMQKRPSFFPPENNVLPRHGPNVSNEANKRFVLTNLWKDSPARSRLGPKIELYYTQCLCLKKLNSLP